MCRGTNGGERLNNRRHSRATTHINSTTTSANRLAPRPFSRPGRAQLASSPRRRASVQRVETLISLPQHWRGAQRSRSTRAAARQQSSRPLGPRSTSQETKQSHALLKLPRHRQRPLLASVHAHDDITGGQNPRARDPELKPCPRSLISSGRSRQLRSPWTALRVHGGQEPRTQ